MNHNPWRTVRMFGRTLVYICCGFMVVMASMLCLLFLSFLLNPFSGQDEFSNLSGYAAQRRLSHWPVGVAPQEVQKVSYKSAYSRDSYSSWYRIKLSESDATKWADFMHQFQKNQSHESLDDQDEGLEGVHRVSTGPPPLHWQTGEGPPWWTPSDLDFRATEIMLWYTNYESGVGRATYTSFDKSESVLWVYDYACQHDQLWPHGKIPPGSVFTASKKMTKIAMGMNMQNATQLLFARGVSRLEPMAYSENNQSFKLPDGRCLVLIGDTNVDAIHIIGNPDHPKSERDIDEVETFAF